VIVREIRESLLLSTIDMYVLFAWRFLRAGAFFSLIGLTHGWSSETPASPRERISLDADWLFLKGDPANAAGKLDYEKIKDWILPTGNAFTKDPAQQKQRPVGDLGDDVAYTQSLFDDSGWRRVNLPHDWAIEGPFDSRLSGATGKLPYVGVGWYRKHLELPASDKGKSIFLEIDGAMSYSAVWCNGQFVGGWPYGYASYQLDLTSYLKPGDNVIAIRLDNPNNSSRWYPGAGIYRNVWLTTTSRVHIAQWGVYVTTPVVSASEATINIGVKIDQPPGTHAIVATSIYELGAKNERGAVPVAETPVESGNTIESSGIQTVQVKVSNPKLWSCDHPNLYTAVTSVTVDGHIVDQVETVFGIRTIKFDANHGFLLNGVHVPINGVCDHHDLGAIGTAFNVRAAERQLEILKEMGCNALRTSHNMPAPELLDLCDRMGILVMDESFDCWETGKVENDYHLLFDDWHEKDLRAEVRRDHNHPSVILYSIGNEVPDERTPLGAKIGSQLTEIVHEEDPTRPTAVACDDLNAGYTDFSRAVDVFGYNYKPGEYAKWHQAHPAIPLFGSETASTVSSRGEYFFPITTIKVNNQVNSYDLWALETLPDTEFKAEDENTCVAGQFVWTGFDYLGEPDPCNSRSSYFGIVDLAGFKKDRFYLYQAVWRPDLPMAHILPHWTWPGREGQVTPVMVYTSGDEAELFVNGVSQGRKQKGEFEYRLRWDEVKYQPGELKVIAYKQGRVWAQDVVKTAGPATQVVLQPDHATIRADGKDLSYVTVTIADKDGLPVPTANNQVSFELSGPAEIVATDNGDPTSLDSFQAPERKAFNGLALVIIRSKPGETGAVTLRATSEGLRSVETTLQSVNTASIVQPDHAGASE
jgi:beta-galactosidase